MASFLAPGGLALVITGNKTDTREAMGPAMLSEEELVDAFVK
jgi:hypothetical protein